MAKGFFVTGTDTGVGKSVAAAWLLQQLDGDYWKPIQSGLSGETDTELVQRLSGLPAERFHPETHRLTEPLSPHESASRDGIGIDLFDFELPETPRPLVTEGAGGALVPLNDFDFMTDLMHDLWLPAVVVARSGLGTINHTLLTLEALERREVPAAGIIINGPPAPHNREALEQFGKIPVLAEIPHLEELTPEALTAIKPEIPDWHVDWIGHR